MMPVSTSRVTLTGTRSRLVAADGMGQKIWVKNEKTGENPAAAVYLGDGTVTSDNGYHLGSNEVWQGYVGPADELFGVTGGGSEVVTVMIVRQD